MRLLQSYFIKLKTTLKEERQA